VTRGAGIGVRSCIRAIRQNLPLSFAAGSCTWRDAPSEDRGSTTFVALQDLTPSRLKASIRRSLRSLYRSRRRSAQAKAATRLATSPHAVRVPSLILIVVYPIRDARGVDLSSGGQFSGHADFINTWNQKDLARIVRDCSQARPRCAHK
jgi:hypothetical protein